MNNKKPRKAVLRQYTRITAGCYLVAAAVVFCLEPHDLAPGGVSGLAIILGRWIPLETGAVILLLNLPLLFLGYRKFGWEFLSETLYATLMTAWITNLLEGLTVYFEWPVLHKTMLWAALIGGVFQAAGIGMIFREGGTTGGTDIVVHLLHQRWNTLSAGWFFLAVDAFVILLSYAAGGNAKEVLHAIISLVVFSALFGWMTGVSHEHTGREKTENIH